MVGSPALKPMAPLRGCPRSQVFVLILPPCSGSSPFVALAQGPVEVLLQQMPTQAGRVSL